MFEDITPEILKQKILEMAGLLLSTEEGGFLDHLAGPFAYELWKLYQALNSVVPMFYVDEGSGEYIDIQSNTFGIQRKAGLKARADISFTGKAGTVILAGTAFLSSEGLEFDLVDEVKLTADGGRGSIEAVEAGSRYNVEAGELTQMLVTLPGLETWTNGAAAGGADPEGDAALVGRLRDRLQRPATSGNVHHYEQWAKEIEGVGAAKVTPLWDGPGTVRVLLAGPGMGPVDGQIVADALAHIEDVRPVGAAVTVESAKGLAIDVACTVRIDSTTTRSAVQAALAEGLEGYIQGVAFTGQEILFNRVAYLVLGIPGVTDYSSLTINGGTGNVPLGEDEVPILGGVNVT